MRKIKRIFALLSVIITTVVVGSVTASAAESISTYPSLKKISSDKIFEQEEKEYYVYFYKERCPYCNEVKDGINMYAENGGKIYGVDYAIRSNQALGYDWNEVAERYNKKIGYVDSDGRKQFFLGESEEKYLNSIETNQYGKIIRYQITVIDEYNIYQFAEASVGDIYTDVQTPEINYAELNDASKLIIAGVPTLLHIKNGRIDGFYFDSPEIAVLLKNIS